MVAYDYGWTYSDGKSTSLSLKVDNTNVELELEKTIDFEKGVIQTKRIYLEKGDYLKTINGKDLSSDVYVISLCKNEDIVSSNRLMK